MAVRNRFYQSEKRISPKNSIETELTFFGEKVRVALSTLGASIFSTLFNIDGYKGLESLTERFARKLNYSSLFKVVYKRNNDKLEEENLLNRVRVLTI